MNRPLMLYCATAVVLTGIWFAFILRPAIVERKSAEAKVVDLQRQLTSYLNLVASMPEYLKTRNTLQSQTKDLHSALYAKNEILQLLERLNRQAHDENLTIVDITPPVSELLKLNRTTGPDEPLFLNITLTLQGDFTGFGKYVNSLEKAPFFRGINSCRIIGPEEINTHLNIVVGFKTLLGQIRESA